MKKNLFNFQRKFIAHLYNNDNCAILDEINYQNDKARARLNIYRNNVIGSYQHMLETIFPICKKLLKNDFYLLAQKYYTKYHSNSGNLDEYGEFFYILLKSHKLKFLPDLAKLELNYYRSYFMPAAKKEFQLEKFKKLHPKKLAKTIFTLHPTCILQKSSYPIYNIFTKEKNTKKNTEYVLISRIFNISEVIKLKKDEFIFLNLIKNNHNLEEIYKVLPKKIDIGPLLNRFISARIITDYKV